MDDFILNHPLKVKKKNSFVIFKNNYMCIIIIFTFRLFSLEIWRYKIVIYDRFYWRSCLIQIENIYLFSGHLNILQQNNDYVIFYFYLIIKYTVNRINVLCFHAINIVLKYCYISFWIFQRLYFTIFSILDFFSFMVFLISDRRKRLT